LALGTSLQIVPAAEVPLRTVERGGAFAVVNLQVRAPFTLCIQRRAAARAIPPGRNGFGKHTQ
jgi:NAD-dependent SIR2 family protein deacetylase